MMGQAMCPLQKCVERCVQSRAEQFRLLQTRAYSSVHLQLGNLWESLGREELCGYQVEAGSVQHTV